MTGLCVVVEQGDSASMGLYEEFGCVVETGGWVFTKERWFFDAQLLFDIWGLG